jgi:redox-sensitive bicupin YhaK (pirin superfamily)
VVLSGDVVVNGPTRATPSQRGVFVQEGAGDTRKVMVASRLLVLSGEPIKEPIVGYGPFVMNCREEIIQAIEEFNARRLGQLPV